MRREIEPHRMHLACSADGLKSELRKWPDADPDRVAEQTQDNMKPSVATLWQKLGQYLNYVRVVEQLSKNQWP
jgi:hypothetical protein